MSETNMETSSESIEASGSGSSQWGPMVRSILKPLASLKLTVVLLAMSAFIVLAGTLAQVDKDVWEAVREYFRIDMSQLLKSRSPGDLFRHLFVWIDVQIFAPPAFFPSKPDLPAWAGFWFPRGWTIGAVMMVNLLAAHLLRFKIQAKGVPLFAGLGVVALGSLLTWAVIVTASTADAVQTETVISYGMVWKLIGLSILAISGSLVFVGLSDGQKPIERMISLLSAVLAGLVSAIVLLQPPLTDPSMRILYQLLKGTICGGVLLAGCWLIFRKRAGVVLLHAGVGMMMVYEVLVGLNAGTMEASMQIIEGQTAVYTTDIRSSELVIVDLSDPKEDVETIIPASMLSNSKKFEDKELPFQVEVLDYHTHSTLYNKKAGFMMSRPGEKADPPTTPDLATTGLGQTFRIEPLDPSVGTDTSGAVDTPSAYVKLTTKDGGQELGTYLVTTVPGMPPEAIEHAGKKYELELRFRRTYTPFHVTLKDVQKNDYVGTSNPKDYRSIITLMDTTRADARPIDSKIWMNNPLRYGGWTFYQSNYDTTRDGREVTALQVVENEGWTIPYIACMITAVAMLFQFFLVLSRFLGKVTRGTTSTGDELPSVKSQQSRKNSKPRKNASSLDQQDKPQIEERSPSRRISSAITASLVATLLFAVVLLGFMRSKRADEAYDLEAFSQIPIFYQGRAQPIDSLARNTMLYLNDYETYRENDKSQPAIRWLLDVISGARGDDDKLVADTHPVFQIENIELQRALGLERRKRFRYALEEFEPKYKSMLEDVKKFSMLKTEDLNLYQRKLLALAQRIQAVQKLQLTFTDPADIGSLPPLPSLETIQNDPATAQQQMGQFREFLENVERLVNQEHVAIVIPMHLKGQDEKPSERPRFSEQLAGRWTPFPLACAYSSLDTNFGMEKVVALQHWQGILAAYRDKKPKEFNQHVADYLQLLRSADADDLRVVSEKDQRGEDQPTDDTAMNLSSVSFEHFFNRVGPFNIASYLYVGAFVFVALGWVFSLFGGMRPLHVAGFVFALLTFSLHALAIAGRIYISGRPPVTNLYSAAVFIGCAASLFGLVIEPFVKRGLGTTLACLTGFLSLRVAGGLTNDGDTFAVLQAVLDTQFWLATHVVTITLGYATTYVAGFIGFIYILGGLLTPAFSPQDRQRLTSMMYGTLCFAIFFSFVGTVLGGLWADDSWGRFWGWDPKENGALIIVLWNAIVLHARWDGMIRERGMAVLCVLGNIVVSWSFFGVNELGVGLHSYGFSEGRVQKLAAFCVSQLVIASLASIPMSNWWSIRAHQNRQQSDEADLPSVDLDPMV